MKNEKQKQTACFSFLKFTVIFTKRTLAFKETQSYFLSGCVINNQNLTCRVCCKNQTDIFLDKAVSLNESIYNTDFCHLKATHIPCTNPIFWTFRKESLCVRWLFTPKSAIFSKKQVSCCSLVFHVKFMLQNRKYKMWQ